MVRLFLLLFAGLACASLVDFPIFYPKPSPDNKDKCSPPKKARLVEAYQRHFAHFNVSFGDSFEDYALNVAPFFNGDITSRARLCSWIHEFHNDTIGFDSVKHCLNSQVLHEVMKIEQEEAVYFVAAYNGMKYVCGKGEDVFLLEGDCIIKTEKGHMDDIRTCIGLGQPSSGSSLGNYSMTCDLVEASTYCMREIFHSNCGPEVESFVCETVHHAFTEFLYGEKCELRKCY